MATHNITGLSSHLSQLLQVRLVSHKNHWCVIRASDAVNKLFKLPNFVETSTIRDGVTDDKPFSCSHVLIPHGCELGLKGRKQRSIVHCCSSDLHTHCLLYKQTGSQLPAPLRQSMEN